MQKIDLNKFFKRLIRKLSTLCVNLLNNSDFSGNTILIFFAILIGLFSGFGVVIFRYLIAHLDALSWGIQIAPKVHFGDLDKWWIFLVPTIGGLIVGGIVLLVPETRGIGVPEVMEAVALRGGIIRARVILTKVFASVICIGSGGSAGIVGPAVQIGSAVGCSFGKLFRMSDTRMKILIGCGFASGLAAVFNVPIAGTIFALEILLGDFTIGTFAPILISAVVSSMVAQATLSKSILLSGFHYTPTSWEILAYPALGMLCGVLAYIFIHYFYNIKSVFRNNFNPPYLNPMLGAAAVGLMGLFYPQILGLGQLIINQAINGHFTWRVMIFLMCFKLLATCLTISSGSSGGTFTPNLFIGAMLGGCIGYFMQILGVSSSPQIIGNFAVLGMMATIAATTGAPLAMIVMLLEMSRDYHLLIPGLIVISFSYMTRLKLSPASIYTGKLLKRGVLLQYGKELSVLRKTKVKQLMKQEVKYIPFDLPLALIIAIISENPDYSCFPVVDIKGDLIGVITLQDIRMLYFKRQLVNINPLIPAIDIADPNPLVISENATLEEAIQKFNLRDIEEIPVISENNPSKIIGILKKRAVLDKYQMDLMNYYPNPLTKH